MSGLFELAVQCLAECGLERKLFSTKRLVARWRRGELKPGDGEVLSVEMAGRPARPSLVAPSRLARRGLGSRLGRAAMMHAIAHIEFNAVNLALDAVQRYRAMPRAYYDDWLRVADEEVRHFELVRSHLHSLGFDYGDFDAHNGLWEMAEKTCGDVLERMALVPRVLEARGLDVTPGMIARLRQAGDGQAAAILEIILRDEIGHVRIGSRWFREVCSRRGLVADKVFVSLLHRHFPRGLHGPFNLDARRQAGFSQDEMALLGISSASC